MINRLLSITMKNLMIAALSLMIILPVKAEKIKSEDLSLSSAGYVSNNESISGFFNAFSSQVNKPVILSKLAARKKISGEISLVNPRLQLDTVCNRLGLIWYSNNATLYIYDSSEIVSRIVTMRNISYSYFTQYLGKVQLLDNRYPLRGEEGNKTFFISGPPIYVETIAQLAATLDEQDTSRRDIDAVSMFYLSNTFAEDRSYTYQDKVIVIPGLATVIRKLFSTPGAVYSDIRTSTTEITKVRLPPPSLPAVDDIEPFDRATQAIVNTSSAVQIISNPSNNSLLIKGSEEQIALAKNIIAAMDKPRRHIELSVWIVDVQKKALEQLGANWKGNFTIGDRLGFSLNQGASASSTGGNLSSTLDGGRFIAEINALSQNNLANIISRPVILTQENIPAIFDNSHSLYTKLLGEHNVELQKITFGTSISVLPRFTQNNEIEMMLNVEDGNSAGSTSESENLVSPLPLVIRTNISTVARVPRGKSLLIGGYTRDEDRNDTVKIPFLGSIPLIGGLFRHRITQNSKTVRIFLIQPREITSENASEANTLSPEMFTSTPLRDWKQNFSMSLL